MNGKENNIIQYLFFNMSSNSSLLVSIKELFSEPVIYKEVLINLVFFFFLLSSFTLLINHRHSK